MNSAKDNILFEYLDQKQLKYINEDFGYIKKNNKHFLQNM